MKTGDQRQQKPQQQLPAGWTLQYDQTTCRPYYYNSGSRKSQWDAPPDNGVQSNDSGWELQSIGQVIAQPVAQVFTSVQSLLPQIGSQSGTSSLPDGWTLHEDPITRRPYYYHATTRTSSWTPPSQSGSSMQAAAVVNDYYMSRPSMNQSSLKTTGTFAVQQQQQQQQQQRQQPLTSASLLNRNIYLYNLAEDRYVMTNGTTYASNLIPPTERPPGKWRCGSRFFVMPLHNGQVRATMVLHVDELKVTHYSRYP